MSEENFKYVKVGDVVTRMLAGTIPMELQVSKITTDRIICEAYEFNRITGHEIDDLIPCLVSFLKK